MAHIAHIVLRALAVYAIIGIMVDSSATLVGVHHKTTILRLIKDHFFIIIWWLPLAVVAIFLYLAGWLFDRREDKYWSDDDW